MNYKALLDILLLPRSFFKKLKDKKPSLYLGIVALGAIDLIIMIIKNYKKIFVEKPVMSLYFNITLIVVLILLLGFIDVLFFSLPLFDLYKRFKNEKDLPARGDELPKLMKVYILANILVFPANLMLYFADKANGNLYESSTVALLSLLVVIWFSAVITRGINVIYNFQPAFKRLVFITVYVWSLLLGIAIQYITDNWILKLFN